MKDIFSLHYFRIMNNHKTDHFQIASFADEDQAYLISDILDEAVVRLSEVDTLQMNFKELIESNQCIPFILRHLDNKEDDVKLKKNLFKNIDICTHILDEVLGAEFFSDMILYAADNKGFYEKEFVVKTNKLFE